MNCREISIEKGPPLSFTAMSPVRELEYSGNNGWNYNGTNGNINTNNKNNAYSVRPVSEFHEVSRMELKDLLNAYKVCRKNKKNAESTVRFEIGYMDSLLRLWRDVNSRVYKPSRSIAFLVKKPKLREIFAADFRDRVIHHYLDIALRPLIEKELVETTCNNRVGKGTGAAVKYLDVSIREVSGNYTKDCYVCKMDLQSFFMSIPKKVIKDKIIRFTKEKYIGKDKESVIYLFDVILSNHPEKNCILKTPMTNWDKLPKNKSLFYSGENGIPIGDLISQLIANFFLSDFDHYMVDELGFTHYGRYVDDFYVVDADKEKILNAIPFIREKLKEIGITLHPDKFYLQNYSKGVEFVGSVIKPHRIYLHNRSVHNAFEAVKKMNKIIPDIENMERFRATVNSYLGMMGNRSTFNIRRRLIRSVDPGWWKYFAIAPGAKKVILKKKYTRKEIDKNKLLNEKRHVSKRNQQKEL